MQHPPSCLLLATLVLGATAPAHAATAPADPDPIVAQGLEGLRANKPAEAYAILRPHSDDLADNGDNDTATPGAGGTNVSGAVAFARVP